MTLKVSALLLSACALTVPAFGQDGGQLFTLYCSACHGADGKGATGGLFPPLAGSPWVAGPPDRIINITLSGLSGPVNVLGKTYNLEMPPQGAAIPDDQLAAVVTYVRSSWGNTGTAVTPELVKKIRAESGNRTEHWTAAELLKLHPLDETPALGNLLSYSYEGAWTALPDFSKLQPSAVEEEQKGFLSLEKAGKKRPLTIAWEGNLTIPADGDYEFQIETKGRARILLDGVALPATKGRGKGPPKGALTHLTKGLRKFRLEYFNAKGKANLEVAWRAKGAENWNPLSDPSTTSVQPSILLQPTAGRPVIYRNFIADATPRTLCVGFPGGVNLAFSIDHLAPQSVWTGKFIDAGLHWTDRGNGLQSPAGTKVVNLSGKPAYPSGTRFLGYDLDAAGNPTFLAKSGTLEIHDAYTSPAPATLVRKITITGTPGSTAPLVLAESATADPSSQGSYNIDGKLTLIAPEASLATGNTLVLPLVPGKTEIRYLWR